MRLNGEISRHEPEPDEEQEEKESGNLQPQEFVVGYALTSKKKKSFLQPKLEVLARYLHIAILLILSFTQCYIYCYL